jgi:hypothetical protein
MISQYPSEWERAKAIHATFVAGVVYGGKMSFTRYLKMLQQFTDGRIPYRLERKSHAFITGARHGYIAANPGVHIQ